MLVVILFPGNSDGKESACSAGDLGSIPGSGRSYLQPTNLNDTICELIFGGSGGQLNALGRGGNPELESLTGHTEAWRLTDPDNTEK